MFHGAVMHFRDGRKETVIKDRLNYVRIKKVDWTTENMTEEGKAAADHEENLRVLEAKAKGDTWEARI